MTPALPAEPTPRALGESLAALATQIADALETVAPRGPAAPYWIGLDRDTYATRLADLRQWADTVLRQHYGGYELRDCWPRHIHAVWELSTLAAEWHHLYSGNHADLGRALEFYDRWLPAPCAASPTSPRSGGPPPLRPVRRKPGCHRGHRLHEDARASRQVAKYRRRPGDA